MSMDKPVKDQLVDQHYNPIMVNKKHDDEKLAITLLIVGVKLIAYYFS